MKKHIKIIIESIKILVALGPLGYFIFFLDTMPRTEVEIKFKNTEKEFLELKMAQDSFNLYKNNLVLYREVSDALKTNMEETRKSFQLSMKLLKNNTTEVKVLQNELIIREREFNILLDSITAKIHQLYLTEAYLDLQFPLKLDSSEAWGQMELQNGFSPAGVYTFSNEENDQIVEMLEIINSYKTKYDLK